MFLYSTKSTQFFTARLNDYRSMLKDDENHCISTYYKKGVYFRFQALRTRYLYKIIIHGDCPERKFKTRLYSMSDTEVEIIEIACVDKSSSYECSTIKPFEEWDVLCEHEGFMKLCLITPQSELVEYNFLDDCKFVLFFVYF